MAEFVIKDEDLVSLKNKVVIITGMAISTLTPFGELFVNIFDLG